MNKYNTNYLKVVSKMYLPSGDYLRYTRGEYMLTPRVKYEIIELTKSDSAVILYEYFYENRKRNHFSPTDDESIGRILSWSPSKVSRIKSLLKKHKYLLVLKDTVKDGTIIYRTILNPGLISFYEKHNELPNNIDVEIRDIQKDK
jgi:hypothetical protein